jgi:glycosyltransferase involved in cell wall biosynthesis
LNACLLVPIYNHESTIEAVLEGLAPAGLPCLVVDDGSDGSTRATLAALAHRLPWVSIECLARNSGRGAALRHGYILAARRGFTHVIQLDADGQHNPADVPLFAAAARARPDALVLGAPRFEGAMPLSRRYGRLLSRFWVWIETLSVVIRDPLCGFRCVPLAPTVALLARSPLGNRMDFDPEIVVRLCWAGVPIVNVPVRVRYFPDGISHFQPFRDNARISWAHTRLVFGMLRRLPWLLMRPRGAQ